MLTLKIAITSFVMCPFYVSYKFSIANGFLLHMLKVTGHREDKNELGMSRICYLRKYSIPEGVDKDRLKPTLTKDGVLIIEAPAPALTQKERLIPIEYKAQ